MKKILILSILVAVSIFLMPEAVMAMDADQVSTFDSTSHSGEYFGTVNEGVSNDGGVTYVFYDDFTVIYTEADPNKEYVLLMVKANVKGDGGLNGETPYSISADNILYIDQKKADGDGKISFDVIPSSVTNSVILLGGSFSDPQFNSPVLLGTVFVSGFEVSGNIELQGRTAGKFAQAEVSLIPATGESMRTNTDALGAYQFSGVAGGNYKFTVSRISYLGYEKNSLTIESNTTLNAIALKGGDIVADGQVTSSDLSTLLSAYLSTTTAPSDINGDGQVTSSDLSILLANYLLSKTVVQ